jgi:DNA-binding MarR family transcriptional regulator
MAQLNAAFRIEESLGHLIAKTHQLFSGFFKEKLEGYGLTPPQFGTLAFLWQQDGISQIRLALLMRKDRTTMSGIIDRLEKEGLVVRRSDPEDRRAHLVYVTPKGAGLRAELEKIAVQSNFELTATLSEKERKQLIFLLKKILEAPTAKKYLISGGKP